LPFPAFSTSTVVLSASRICRFTDKPKEAASCFSSTVGAMLVCMLDVKDEVNSPHNGSGDAEFTPHIDSAENGKHASMHQ